jgi:hypothetical protein
VKCKPTADVSLSSGVAGPLIDAVLLTELFAANPLTDFVDPDDSGPEGAVLSIRRLYGPVADMLLDRTFSYATTNW